jgi:hypothetical protein
LEGSKTPSLEHQHLAKQYVLRGVESGGAVADLGAYSSFTDEQGNALAWLQRVDTVGVNGVHAIVVAPALVRIEMLRVQRTYDVLITRHGLRGVGQNQRPRLESSILFYGRRGTLEMELWGKDAAFRGAVCPAFYSRTGEALSVPVEFQDALTRISAAVCCVGCRHCHLLQPGSAVRAALAGSESWNLDYQDQTAAIFARPKRQELRGRIMKVYT